MERSTAMIAALALVAGCGGGEADDDTYADEMAREHAGDRPVAAASADGETVDSVETTEVTFATVEGGDVTGYLAEPAGASDSLPAVVVIHEWWGLNDNIRTMTRRLAGHGYAALAVDLYGGQVASTPDRARELVGSVDEEAARENLRQAHAWLADRGSPRVASLGWCFGGGWSLQTALLLPDQLDAAVIYYGRPVTEADRLSALEMPVQGHFGSEDGSIPVSEVRAFEAALDSAGVSNDIYVYRGAGHAFANPSGERYEEEAARQAWARTLDFLDRHLKR
ncbi:MAG: dienelactone hydrolase family protein [Acidobacteriota bacterium]